MCDITSYMCIGVCPKLLDPTNGKVFLQGSNAIFVCFSGATIMGSPILACSNGTWSGSPPTCEFLNP